MEAHGLFTNLMILYVPVRNKESNISIWCPKRYRNNISVVNNDSPISTCSSLEAEGRKVKETAYLVFDLKLVCPIPTSRNWTVCSWNTILPRIFSLLNAIPALLQEQLLHCHQYMPLYWGLEIYHVRRNGSSRLFLTLTTTFQLVVTFRMGPGNLPSMPITWNTMLRSKLWALYLTHSKIIRWDNK